MSLTSLASLIKILYMRIKSDLIYIIETIRYSVLEVAAAAVHIAQIKYRTSPGRGLAVRAGGDLSCRGSYQAVNSLRMDTSSTGRSRPGPVTVHRIWIHLEPPRGAGGDKFRAIAACRHTRTVICLFLMIPPLRCQFS